MSLLANSKNNNIGIISMIVMVIALLIGGNALLSIQIEKQVQQSVTDTLDSFNASIVKGVESWLAQNETIISVWANSNYTNYIFNYLSSLQNDTEQLQQDDIHDEIESYFHVLLAENNFQGYALISRDNTILSSNIHSEIGSKHSALQDRSVDTSNQNFILFPNHDLHGNHATDHFLLGTPVLHKGSPAGTLLLRVNSSSSLSPLLKTNSQRFYQNIYAFSEDHVFTDKKDLQKTLSGPHAESSGVIPLSNIHSDTAQLLSLIENALNSRESVNISGYRNFENREVVGYFRWLPRHQIGIAYEMEKNALYAPLGFIKGLQLTITLGVIAVGIFLLLHFRKTSNALKDQVHEKTRDVSKLNKQINLILDSAGEGICGLDEDGCCIFINKAATEILEYESGEIIGRHLHELIHHTHEDGSVHPKEDCPMYRSMQEGKVYEVDFDAFWGKGDQKIPVEYVSSPLIEDERIVGSVVIFRDISKKMEVERMKNEFISTVSHELRTPLTSIKGAVELMDGIKQGELDNRMAGMLEIAKRNSSRLLLLINDILDISKLESNKMTFNYADYDLHELLTDALILNQEYGHQFNVEFKLESTTRFRVCIDKDRFQQIMSNLLSNAAKFSPSNSTVEIGSYFKDDKAIVYVRDYGSGIPEEFHDRIFSKFSQADSSDTRKIGGTGLGLAISKNMIENMKGSIWFESQVGKGTCFCVSIPLAIGTENYQAS